MSENSSLPVFARDFKNKQLNTVTHFATRDMRKKKKEVGKCHFLFAHLINLLFVLHWSFTELLTHYFINNPEVRRAARSSRSHSLFQTALHNSFGQTAIIFIQ